ncbi:putative hydrolase [Thalassoglobus polymorphus]|uniref:Putative hydrolase n=1 Tax=Thalassoglobus polymorphus TaxID=2527994 RepID=A0A517QUC0_9PLAN|nr:putative hydrolase [Thalassoglobus polymorphus]
MSLRQHGSASFYFIAGFCCLTIGLSSYVRSAEKETDLVKRFESKTFSASNDLDLGYRMLSPKKVESGKKYPLVLFLHGAGERGDDNKKQLVHVAQELATDEMQARHSCFVIAPQAPNETRWVEVDWGLDAHKMPKTPSVPMAATFELLEQLKKDLPVDVDRIYICGLSMGGYGTWDAVQRHPELFAGAISICGGGDPAYAEQIANVPVWAFHGDADTAVKVHRSREMVNAVRKAGGEAIYTEYAGVGHNSWAVTAANRLVWDWLFAQKKHTTK